MIGQRTLYLDENGMSAYRRQAGQWISEETFPNTPAGHVDFAAYLQRHRPQPFHLLADLAHETLLLERIPRLGRRDRQQLMQRKLEQHFPGNPLRTATPLGRDPANPQKEIWRLSAFTRAEDFAPWLAPITQAASRLTGIYSSSQLLGQLLRQHEQPHAEQLLLLASPRTLRQFFLRQGEVHFYRSLPSRPADPQQLAEESSKLQHYLLKQQHIAPGDSLPVCIHGSAESPPASTARLSFQPLGAAPLAPLAPRLLAALTHARPRTQFAQPSLLQAARLARLRLAASVLAGGFALLSLPMAAWQYSVATELRQESRRAPSLLPLPASQGPADLPDAATLRLLAETYNHWQQTQRQPRAAFRTLSLALDQHPAIHLETLAWQNNEGQESLRLEGRLLDESPGATSDTPRPLADFVAALGVDRRRQLRLRYGKEETGTTASWRGHSADSAQPAPRNFTLDLQPRP